MIATVAFVVLALAAATQIVLLLVSGNLYLVRKFDHLRREDVG